MKFECCRYCKPPKRCSGCHSKCPEYKKASIKNELEKRRKRKDQEERDALRSPAYETRARKALNNMK